MQLIPKIRHRLSHRHRKGRIHRARRRIRRANTEYGADKLRLQQGDAVDYRAAPVVTAEDDAVEGELAAEFGEVVGDLREGV